MSDRTPSLVEPPAGYVEWLTDLKARVQAARQRATLSVNVEQLALYRHIGLDLVQRQA